MAEYLSKQCIPHLTKPLPAGTNPRQVVQDFMDTINMSPREIEEWLGKEESRKAAEQGTDEEKEGRHLARRVIELLDKVGEHRQDPHAYELSLLYEADLQQMHQISDYIRCQLEHADQKSAMDRYHLMNFGFDLNKVGQQQQSKV